MATAVQGISERDWAALTGDKGLEYINGKLVSRGMTSELHGDWANAIALYLHSKGFWSKQNVIVRPPGGEFRPDVLVKTPHAPKEEYLTHPPAMVFEVLSKSNPWTEMQYKFRAYEKWGVILSLLVDPETQEWWRFQDGVFQPLKEFTFNMYEIWLDLREIPRLIP